MSHEKHHLLNGDTFDSSRWWQLDQLLKFTDAFNNQTLIRALGPAGDWQYLLGMSYHDHKFSFIQYGSQFNNIDMQQFRELVRDKECDLGAYIYLCSGTDYRRWHIVGCSEEYSLIIRDKIIVLDIDWTSPAIGLDAD